MAGSYFHRDETRRDAARRESSVSDDQKVSRARANGQPQNPEKKGFPALSVTDSFTGRCHLAAAAAFAPCAFGCFGARTQTAQHCTWVVGGRLARCRTMDVLMHVWMGLAPRNRSDDGSELVYHSITGRPSFSAQPQGNTNTQQTTTYSTQTIQSPAVFVSFLVLLCFFLFER